MRYYRACSVEKFQERFDPKTRLYTLSDLAEFHDKGFPQRIYIFKKWTKPSIDALFYLTGKIAAGQYAFTSDIGADFRPLILSGELDEDRQQNIRSNSIFGYFIDGYTSVPVDKVFRCKKTSAELSVMETGDAPPLSPFPLISLITSTIAVSRLYEEASIESVMQE